MRMGELLLEAKTPIALTAGEPIKLLVKSLGEMPILTILGAALTPRLAAQNLKTLITQQQGLSELLLLGQKIIKNPAISETLKQQLLNLRQQLPDAEQVTQAKILRKLIQNSGVFLESKLNHLRTLQRGNQQTDVLSHDALQSDVKSQLLRISAQLQNDVPGLTLKPSAKTIKSIQSIINRFIKGKINLIQLATLLTIKLSKSQHQLIQRALTTTNTTRLPNELLNSFALLLNHIQKQANSQQIQNKLADLLKTMDILHALKTGVDGALAKITSHQLIPLTRETDSLFLLLFDLPIKDRTENHLIQFRLEQEQPARDQSASSWMVTLNFNFKQLGSIQAQLHLTDSYISTAFRAEKKATVKNISEQINWLDAALKRIGFNTIKLGVSHGNLRQPSSDVPTNVRLLDEKA